MEHPVSTINLSGLPEEIVNNSVAQSNDQCLKVGQAF